MSDQEEINPYQLLDISLDASDADIKSAYRKLSLKVHPDRVRVHIRLQSIASNL
jgi:DnaJ homolog subfamily C member 17